MPVLMFKSWFLNEIRNIDLSLVMVGMLIKSSNFCPNEAHLNSDVRI